ncbi:hypothetical protein [Almyronema epifaneia]|uniref:Transposase DDE domain-containing protein n=1 Tax=Almyronema epifaneia S1 TaxID=2991925 RepID=A0ABW6IH17_9CYAN
MHGRTCQQYLKILTNSLPSHVCCDSTFTQPPLRDGLNQRDGSDASGIYYPATIDETQIPLYINRVMQIS